MCGDKCLINKIISIIIGIIVGVIIYFVPVIGAIVTVISLLILATFILGLIVFMITLNQDNRGCQKCCYLESAIVGVFGTIATALITIAVGLIVIANEWIAVLVGILAAFATFMLTNFFKALIKRVM